MTFLVLTIAKLSAAVAVRGQRIRLFLQTFFGWQFLLVAVVSLWGSVIFNELDALGAGPWKGQIVDKETGKPLEEVVLLASWYKAYSTPGGWGGAGYYDSEEVVTDANGRFIIQSRQTWTLNPFSRIKGPEFYIFKPGYGRWQFKGQDGWSKDALVNEEQRKQAWRQFTSREGIVMELPPLKTREERLQFYQSPGRTPPGDVPPHQMKRWKDADDAERGHLGFR